MTGIDYFYSAHSAFAYLGAVRLSEIAAASGQQINHRPMDLRKVVAAAHPDGFAKRSKAHIDYYFGREIERWAEYRGVSFLGGIPANHGNDTTLANSMLVACIMQAGKIDQLAYAMLKAHWLDHADLADEAILAGIAKSAGIDPAPLLLGAKSPEAKAIYDANTAEAIKRSVFGSPTYFVDGDMFYGQDRLELVERAIKQPFANTWP